jgi:DNA-directed RNA polymerase specialized sigma24 family protein
VDKGVSGAPDGDLDLWLYRDRTVGLLRRYRLFSLETGRLPSIVGREFFRAKVSSYRAVTFEDRVIFVHDVEKCLERLAKWDQQLVARVILQEYSHGQAAYLLHCSRKTVERRLTEVLDLLSEEFLKAGLLVAIPSKGKE